MVSLQTMMFFILASTVTASFQIGEKCTELTESFIYRKFEADQSECWKLVSKEAGIGIAIDSIIDKMNVHFAYCKKPVKNFIGISSVNITRSAKFFEKNPNCPAYALLKLHNPNDRAVEVLMYNKYKKSDFFETTIACILALTVFSSLAVALCYKHYKDKTAEHHKIDDIHLQAVYRAD